MKGKGRGERNKKGGIERCVGGGGGVGFYYIQAVPFVVVFQKCQHYQFEEFQPASKSIPDRP